MVVDGLRVGWGAASLLPAPHHPTPQCVFAFLAEPIGEQG